MIFKTMQMLLLFMPFHLDFSLIFYFSFRADVIDRQRDTTHCQASPSLPLLRNITKVLSDLNEASPSIPSLLSQQT